MAALLNWMIFAPLLGAGLCLMAPSVRACRRMALATTLVTLAMSIVLAWAYYAQGYEGAQFVTAIDWIGVINAEYRVGLDGLSLPLVLLT